MAAFALDAFERQAEAFWQAKTWRDWQYMAGLRPGRGLVTLYDDDFPDFTSTDLVLDLRDAAADDPRRTRALTALLAGAYLEGRTRQYATEAARFVGRKTIEWEGQAIPWREASAHWTRTPEVQRRHALADAWRTALRADLNPVLEHWHEALRAQLTPIGAQDWLSFWAEQDGLDLNAVARLATSVLDVSADVFSHALGVYLAQLELPIDDVWTADVDWALRAPRFDGAFPETSRMPVLVRAFRDLGVEIESQAGLRLETGPLPGVHVLAVNVPQEVHVVLRLAGGYQDYARSLRGLGVAQHVLHTDATLPFWQRSLGDDAPVIGSGLLLEGLARDKTWLSARLDYLNSDDYRIIAHIAWLYRVRTLAASALFEPRLWQLEPGSSLAADFETDVGTALRTRVFPDEYLLPLVGAPWSTLWSAVALRAEVFAAQLRAYLAREFDEEWWRSERAARFLIQELWRPGRRHSADELLGFMGFPTGFDACVLWKEIEEVLSPL